MTNKMTRMRAALLVIALLLVIVSGAFALNAVYVVALTSWWALIGLPAVLLGLNALGNVITGWYLKPVREETEQIRLETRELKGRIAAMREFNDNY